MTRIPIQEAIALIAHRKACVAAEAAVLSQVAAPPEVQVALVVKVEAGVKVEISKVMPQVLAVLIAQVEQATEAVVVMGVAVIVLNKIPLVALTMAAEPIVVVREVLMIEVSSDSDSFRDGTGVGNDGSGSDSGANEYAVACRGGSNSGSENDD